MEVRAVREHHIREMRHCVGLDYQKPRRGKYAAYRNYVCYNTPNYCWEHLVKCGYAALTIEDNEHYIPAKQYIYRLTREGMDFLGAIIGAEITEKD